MRYFVFIVPLLFSLSIKAQKTELDSLNSRKAVGNGLFRVAYAAQVPTGDFADRFGFSNTIGASAGYKTKSNWIFTVGGYYLFGDDVKAKNTLLSSMTNSSGLIIDQNGDQAFINISQQGYMIDLQIAKLLPWGMANPNSGVIIGIGVGFYEHWIGLRADGNTVPQLVEDYQKGYDRLTNGMFIQEFIGYHFQGESRLLNFYGGFEFTQGFAGNRRSYDIPSMQKIDDKYTDFLFGFKVGWMMPFYKREKDKYYYY